MFKEKSFTRCAKTVKRAFFFSSLFSLMLISGCYQRFERVEVKAGDEGIIFSHPAMDEAIRRGNLCIFGEISISRRDSTDQPLEEVWSLQNTASGFQPTTEPLKKSYLVYGETLPQTRVLVEPKPLREGAYRVSGVVVIYNQKRELLRDLAFTDKFVLKTDVSGKMTVSSVEN